MKSWTRSERFSPSSFFKSYLKRIGVSSYTNGINLIRLMIPSSMSITYVVIAISFHYFSSSAHLCDDDVGFYYTTHIDSWFIAVYFLRNEDGRGFAPSEGIILLSDFFYSASSRIFIFYSNWRRHVLKSPDNVRTHIQQTIQFK